MRKFSVVDPDFEAFGELESVEGDLAATAAILATRGPPVLRRGEGSCYPGWLASPPGG